MALKQWIILLYLFFSILHFPVTLLFPEAAETAETTHVWTMEYWKGQRHAAQCSHSQNMLATEIPLLHSYDKGHRTQQEAKQHNCMLSRAAREAVICIINHQAVTAIHQLSRFKCTFMSCHQCLYNADLTFTVNSSLSLTANGPQLFCTWLCLLTHKP